MSDWKFLNSKRHRGGIPGIMERYVSEESDGFNGMFRFMLDGKLIRCIASDGEGWQHVSASIEGEPSRVPTWQMMCKIKELFFEDEDVAVQYHPAKSQYVNNHKGCLHLWKPTHQVMPAPPSILVGFK